MDGIACSLVRSSFAQSSHSLNQSIHSGDSQECSKGGAGLGKAELMDQRLSREQPLGVRCRGVEQDDHSGWENSCDRFEKRARSVENREKRVVGDGSKVASSLRGTGMNNTNRNRVDS